MKPRVYETEYRERWGLAPKGFGEFYFGPTREKAKGFRGNYPEAKEAARLEFSGYSIIRLYAYV